MVFGFGTGRVAASQKVADNKRPTDPKRSFTVAWDKHEAQVADVVGITGNAHISIEDASKLKVSILYEGKYYAGANGVQVKKNGTIIAAWKVAPAKMGNFTEGQYDVEISYGGLTGRTTRGLKLVKAGSQSDGFDG